MTSTPDPQGRSQARDNRHESTVSAAEGAEARRLNVHILVVGILALVCAVAAVVNSANGGSTWVSGLLVLAGLGCIVDLAVVGARRKEVGRVD